MSWAYGVENGREVGYSVEATCDEQGCAAKIDRGISYRCGEEMQLHGGHGCGGFYCVQHRPWLYCGRCAATAEDEDDEE